MKIQKANYAQAGGRVSVNLELADTRTHLVSLASKDEKVVVLFESKDMAMPPIHVAEHLRRMADDMDRRRAALLATNPNAAGGIA